MKPDIIINFRRGDLALLNGDTIKAIIFLLFVKILERMILIN